MMFRNKCIQKFWIVGLKFYLIILKLCSNLSLGMQTSPDVLKSLFPYVHVLMSLCTYVLMSLCPYVLMSLCPYVLMSLCPYVLMSLCHYVLMSGPLKLQSVPQLVKSLNVFFHNFLSSFIPKRWLKKDKEIWKSYMVKLISK